MPALLRSGNTGRVQILNEDEGMLLGIFSSPELGERTLMLATNDQLLLVTDGVLEGLCACQDIFSSDKLSKLFADRRTLESGVVDTVFDETVRASSNGVQHDDMTVLALGWKTEQAFGTTL